MKRSISICSVFLLISPLVQAEEALIAVATNFVRVAEQLEAAFEATTEHRITITSGSTGSLYAQIRNGAPYDALLAADQERPLLLLRSDDAADGSSFTFAIGRLVLWSADSELIQADLSATILQDEVITLAIANPALAPYGKASREALQSLQIWDEVRNKIVLGQNVGQTNAMIATGNAQAGIVSLSLMLHRAMLADKDFLLIPEEYHGVIRQDAVLLSHGRNNSAAIDFLSFLQSVEGQAIIKSNGYGVD